MKACLRAVGAGIAAVLSGLWLGEHAATRPFGADLLVLLAIVPAATVLLRPASRAKVALVGVGVTLVFCAAWLAGAKEAQLAFNECIDHGESVRRALENHRSIHGQFPFSLAEIHIDTCGELALPPNTLSYHRLGSGYVLSFADRLVTHEATDTRGFEPRK